LFKVRKKKAKLDGFPLPFKYSNKAQATRVLKKNSTLFESVLFLNPFERTIFSKKLDRNATPSPSLPSFFSFAEKNFI
jgi:hypothetical protein